VKETQRDKALREVKASLLLSRIPSGRRFTPRATRWIGSRAPGAGAAGTRGRAAHEVREGRHAGPYRFDHIQTEKTLTFLFEQARKTA
jgi:hypothetical protein